MIQPGLAFLRLDQRPPLVITTLGADRVGRNGTAALGAIRDLAFFDAVMRSALAGTAIGMFAFGDGHRCGSVKSFCISSDLSGVC